MNTVSRGIRNAFRNPIRTLSIVIILSLSIGLIIAMLAARQGVSDKIESVKSSTGNTISISPAGMRGMEGGGDALTSELLTQTAETEHVTKVVQTLSSRMTSDDTSLEASIEAGGMGQRNAESGGMGIGGGSAPTRPSSDSSDSSDSSSSSETSFTMPVTITGINDVSAISTSGGTSGTLSWTDGEMFDASEDENVAVLGTAIAEKNDLSVGDTFTAYGETIKVVGIYDSGNTFNNGGVYVSLSTLQRLSDQEDSVTSATVTVDSSDNLASVTSALETLYGDKADITNSQETADATTQPLESVKTITLFTLIGAVIAGAIIILLTMVMIVRERRREIGVMKAIGSSNLRIMWQFVAESITLTTVSLVFGLVLGIVAAAPLTSMLIDNSSSSSQSQSEPGSGGGRGGMRGVQQAAESVQSAVGPTVFAGGIGAALLIAVLGSALPSLMISKIKPATAMRSE